MREFLYMYAQYIYPAIVAILGLALIRMSYIHIKNIVLAFEEARKQYNLYPKAFAKQWSEHPKRKEVLMWYVVLFGGFLCLIAAYYSYQLFINF